jgi:RNA polymerase subunit RPABC4/transcription elongation factor Spt4
VDSSAASETNPSISTKKYEYGVPDVVRQYDHVNCRAIHELLQMDANCPVKKASYFTASSLHSAWSGMVLVSMVQHLDLSNSRLLVTIVTMDMTVQWTN